MDFIVGLPNTYQKHDSIWVIIDKLTRTAHFLPVHTTYSTKKYAELYLDQIIRLHGVPKTIISDHGAQFVARFLEQLQASLGTKLIRSSAYHPQTDGKTERVNQILEDMLRACVIQYDKNWDKCLTLVEFSYNNSQSKIHERTLNLHWCVTWVPVLPNPRFDSLISIMVTSQVLMHPNPLELSTWCYQRGGGLHAIN